MTKVRSVIYARCSTEEESQKDALVKQVAEAKECVKQQGWVLVDTYIESRSGTSTRGRGEYNRLYRDLTGDRFDLIVIKSQDRLMRNTKDWYLFIDRLTTVQKRLYLYLEHKFYSADDALITGIKAILAEDYSRELSKKINNAHYNRQKSGSSVLLTNHTYGYRKGPDKSVEVVEEEAKIKRYMYELCAAGYGSRTIANILKQEGIRNQKGNPFSDGDIRRMIKNPLNKGTVVMHKTHYDFDSKRTTAIPKEEQFVYENRIPAIVSDQLWKAANDAIAARVVTKTDNHSFAYGKNRGKTRLSGKLYCGLCGAPFYRTKRQAAGTGEKIREWSCRSFLQNGKDIRQFGCDNIHLKEEAFCEILEEVCLKKVLVDKEIILGSMMKILASVLGEPEYFSGQERAKEKEEKLERQMSFLVDKLLEGVLSERVYQIKQKELENALAESRARYRNIEEKSVKRKELRQRLDEIRIFMEKEDGMRKAMLAELLDEVEKIWVYPSYAEVQSGAVLLERSVTSDVTKAGCSKIRIEYGTAFQYFEQKREERECIVNLMKEKPTITARQIAENMGLSLSGVNYRIRILKKEGRICFQGGGGKGKWNIL